MAKEKIKRKSITLYFTENNKNEMNLYDVLQNFESPLNTVNGNIKSILYDLLVLKELSYMDIFSSNNFNYDKVFMEKSNVVNIDKDRNIDYDFFDELEDNLR